ncbi:hypothetical protein D3C78_1242690 [compost metagenome]
MVAMALIRSGLAVLRSTTRRPTGTISAPPKPCRIRAAVKVGRLTLAAHSTDARVKISTAAAKILRAPKRLAIQPLAGINTVSVRM